MKSSDEMLLTLAAAEAAILPRREPFFVFRSAGGNLAQHPAWAEEVEVVDQDIEELEAAGYVRVKQLRSAYSFTVTDAGRRHAGLLRAAVSSTSTVATAEGHPLAWEDRVLPVLEAVGRAYGRAQAELGVSREMIAGTLGQAPDDPALLLVLHELTRTGYLETTIDTDQVPGPAWCRLGEKGLQVTAGWPSRSGEIAFERLLAMIDEQIEHASGEDKRTWERLRDGVVGVGRDVFTGVLTTAANAAAKGMLS